ncbi:hypothetical protein BSL78_18773 [Apostichopus japonicus]|uniref:Uncharacterized protein n=1 Tax=Stichopus japonicus TaxID=307972 RepID=A0A2G8K8T8_STIJA|nr:hypothetical protein BSL78_18773 [Apostichopus japonicus]
MAASSSGGVSQNSLKENCLMHVKDCSKSKFIELTSSSLDRFKKFALEWTKFDCKEAEIARNSATAIGLTLTDSECVGEVSLHPDIGYHYDCYKRFCDISKVKRQAKLAEKRAAETNVNKLDDDADEKEPPRKRALRSDSASGPREWRERHMFPNECIICHSVKTKRNKFTGKRLVVKLMRCEIINGGKLLEAARQKKHVELLQQIEGEDLVARELKYHWECFRDFTRFISKKSKVGLTDSQKRYMPSFEEFSDKTIRKRLLEGKEILTLARLNRIFIRTIKEVEGIDAPYRTWNLKKRLQKAFPQLVFVNPSHRNMSTIVLSERLCAEELAKDLADDYYTSTDSSTEEEQHMEKEQTYSTEGYVRVLFNAALMTKFELEKKSLSIPWPPAAEDLTIQKTKELVPHCLFNFLAWLTGAADEPEDAKFVAVSNENEKKLLSIAQDILFIAKGGKQPLPKHFALATAVRHLTGSAQLVGILNGLGHSIAHSTLLEYNTALAMRQIDLGENALPPEIQPNHFTTIVWDNIDFGEETLSGKGTTHSTNGIMIQRPRQSARITSTPAMKRTRARTLQPPPVEITPFLGCGEKRGPFCIGKDVDVGKNSYKGSEIDGRNLDMAYNLVRSKFSGIPGWTGFNTYLSTKIPQRSVIAYLPVLNASPTEMDTVQTTLTRSLKYADSLGQDVMVLVFDQAIYAKAQQIRWRDETLKQRLVIRLGMFHTKMAYLACIGKRYKDAGLSDILIESGVIALGSINGVMNGHHYNRSMRAHKLMHDALRNLQWEAYIESVPEQERLTINDILTKLKSGFHKKEVSSIVSSNDFQSVVSSFQDFLAKMNKESPTFAFWSSYVNMVENVLLLTRATRTGNWQLHLSIIRRILPWMFAYDRPNYSRYLSAYYLEMCDLQTTHPLAYDALSSGEFAVQRQEGHGFAQVECDICIEQTVNRDAKTKGGLVGFTTNHGAVLRWLLTQHQCSAITNECKAMTAKKGQARIRKDLDQSRIEHDEKDVESIVSIVRNMVNPFDVEGDNLLHLSSGVVASDKVKHDLMQAEEIGVTKFTAFCRNNLQKESTSFYDPIKRCNLATFEAAKKKTMTKVKGKTVTLKADRKLLARLVFIAKVRNIDIQNLMTYCLGPLPLPFATEQGALVKTNKATLMHCVESAAKRQ